MRMISVVMPAYNAEKNIADAVESVLSQTYTNWELLIINDGSTDKTEMIAEDFAKKDDRIRVMNYDSNRGAAAARNLGVSEAASEWIALLDSDDLWNPNKLEKQVTFAEKHPEAKLIFTATAFAEESGQLLEYILHVPDKIDRKELLKQNSISCSSVLIRRALLLNNPMSEKDGIHEDYTTWLRILEKETYAYGLDEPLLIYRLSAGGKSRNKVKSAKMTWNTYMSCGLKKTIAIRYMFSYAYRGVKKHCKLKRKKKRGTELI